MSSIIACGVTWGLPSERDGTLWLLGRAGELLVRRPAASKTVR